MRRNLVSVVLLLLLTVSSAWTQVQVFPKHALVTAREFDGVADDLSIATPVVTTYPFSISVWFYLNQLPSTKLDEMGIIDIDRVASTNDFWTLRADDAADKLQFNARVGGGTVGVAVTVNTLIAKVWQHAFVIATSATDRIVVLNGDFGNKGTNTSNILPLSLDQTIIGQQGPQDNNFDGRIAQVVIWKAALTEAEGVKIAGGYDPRRIRPEAIFNGGAYWPMNGNFPERDLSGRNNHLTVTGTKLAQGPPQLLSKIAVRRFWFAPSPAGGIGITGPIVITGPVKITD